MKIALVGTIDNPIRKDALGGTEMWTYNFGERLVKNGHDVTLYASSESSFSGKVIGITDQSDFRDQKTNEVRKQKYIMSTNEQLMRVLSDQDNYDIIHFSIFPFYYALPVAERIRKPVVITLHGYCNLSDVDTNKIVKSYQHPNYVFVSNSYAKNWPKPKNFVVIRNGVNPDDFEFNETPEDYYFFIGRVSESKGIEEAIQFALKSGEKLVIAGPTAGDDFFEKVVKPKLSDQIKYIGTVNFSQKKEWYKNAKALIFPIREKEPLPLVVLESLASGTPVLSFKIDPMPELIENGQTGFLAEPARVDQLANYAQRIEEIDRRKCRTSLETAFNFENMICSYEKLYEKIVK